MDFQYKIIVVQSYSDLTAQDRTVRSTKYEG